MITSDTSEENARDLLAKEYERLSDRAEFDGGRKAGLSLRTKARAIRMGLTERISVKVLARVLREHSKEFCDVSNT